MPIRPRYSTVLDMLTMPHIIRLKHNLYAAAFCIMKLLPARFILDKGREQGLVRAESTIIETTSGTFGLALALVCNQLQHRLILVSDPAIDEPFQRRLEELGAKVDIVREPVPVGGFQGARLARLAEIQAQYPDHFWPAQYDNMHNPSSYALLSELLSEQIGQVDCLVGTVGSGGSMSGTSHHLRQLFPHLYAIGVDTHGSVLFGLPDGKRLLRGLGNSLMPKNVVHNTFDEIHWVSAAEGFLATRQLHRRHALFMGPTSGTAYMVAHWRAQQHPDETVVVLLPDEGHRYLNTVYNDEWLRAHQVWLADLPQAPELVRHPAAVSHQWSRILWQRRSYEQVLEHPFQASSLIASPMMTHSDEES